MDELDSQQQYITDLENLRHSLGLSNNKFAFKIGISKSEWSLLRRGRRTLSRKAIKKIVNAYPDTAIIFRFLIPPPLGVAIRHNRMGRGLSQQALGDLAGVSDSFISNLEIGNHKGNISVAALKRLERVFGLEDGTLYKLIQIP